MAFPTLVNKLLPAGLKGLILCGLFASLIFVFLIICAIFLLNPSKKLVFGTLLGSVVFTILLKWLIPDMNYLNRSAIVITATTLFVAVPTVYKNGWPLTWNKLFTSSSKKAGWWGFTLFASLIFCHIIFH